HLTPAVRMRLNYQGWLDRLTIGLASTTAKRVPGRSHVQGWFTLDDPAVGAKVSPHITVGDWALDGTNKFMLERTWNLSPFVYANAPQRNISVAFTSTIPYDFVFVDPTRWDRHAVQSISGAATVRGPAPDSVRVRGLLDAGFVSGTNATRGYV